MTDDWRIIRSEPDGDVFAYRMTEGAALALARTWANQHRIPAKVQQSQALGRWSTVHTLKPDGAAA